MENRAVNTRRSCPKVTVVLSVYRSSGFLSHYLEALQRQTLLSDTSLSVVLNDPTDDERDAFRELSRKVDTKIVVVPRESLYRSMNRAVLQAEGDYLTWWNIDDFRFPDSLEIMAATLDNNPSFGFTYGNFYISDRLRGGHRRLIEPNQFSREEGTRKAMFGPFYMWRRSLVETVGLFDEQFKICGDFDYTVRLSLASDAIKSPSVHGVFQNSGRGLSTRSRRDQVRERTVIQLRYRIYPYIDLRYLSKLSEYSTNEILKNDCRPVKIDDYVYSYKYVLSRSTTTSIRSYLYTVFSLLIDFVSILRRLWK